MQHHVASLTHALDSLRRILASDRARMLWAGIFCLFLCSLFVTDKVRLHRNIYYVLVLAPFLIQVGRRYWADLPGSPVFLAALAFLGYLWITLFWSSASGGYVFYNEARTLVILFSFLAITAFYALNVDDFPRLLAKWLACVAGVAALVSVYVFYSGKHISMLGGLESRAVDIGLAGHPIDSAGLYGFVAVFLVFGLIARGGTKARSQESGVRSQESGGGTNALWSWIGGAALVAVLVFVVLTQTRGALVGIALVVGLGLLVQGDRRLLLVLAVLIAAILTVILFSLHHPEGMIGVERRLGVRGEIWSLALERAWERPWFGFGLNEHQNLISASGELHGVAHNLYLENLHFGGLVGTFLLLALAALALRGAWREYRRTGGFLLPAIVLYPLVFGISAGYLTLSKISPMWIQFWLPVGLVIAAEIRARRDADHAGKI
ncbi:O-antigen ligase family protein [Desulfonatronum lacustre]|uniref:O-antigen ligase family protein n=1 Tax=Desulfonatronum lacustre TaxID=66849 RepID=UPI00048B84F7|nr:O-antigen ligase family protein [Desulfonatronum lacustre]